MRLPVPGGAPRIACRDLPFEHLLLPGVHLFDPTRGLDERPALVQAARRIKQMNAGEQQVLEWEVAARDSRCPAGDGQTHRGSFRSHRTRLKAPIWYSCLLYTSDA